VKLQAAILCLALAAPLAAVAGQQPAAPAEDDIASRIISTPVPSAYRLDGVRSGGGVRRDPAVQGGKALRVPVPGRSEQAWSVSVAVPITRAVRSGDLLVLAFWARLERGEDGATSTVLPYNAVQMSGAPYTAVFNGPVTIGPEWRLVELRGRANRDYAAGELNVSIHLATARQTVDIGPVFVLNMGQDGR
jgi:hypothetical protein